MHFSRERFQLQLIADAFNALNRPNADEVFSVYGTYDFCSGLVSKHYKDSVSVAMQNFGVAGCPAGGPQFRTTFSALRERCSTRDSFSWQRSCCSELNRLGTRPV